MKTTVHIRKQGGAAIMTIPVDVLKALNIAVGSEIEFDLTRQGFFVRPVRKTKRKRYDLKTLLKGCSQKNMRTLNKATAFARTGKSKGREIA